MQHGRILILEDDVHVGKLVKLIAEGGGFDARLVSSPELFFEMIEEWGPTHIALDLVMPDMDGVQVLTQLAKHGCGARIIITSGMGLRVLDAAMRAGHEHGLNMIGALPKPYSATTLRALLKREPEPDLPIPTAAQTWIEPSDVEVRRAFADYEFSLVYQPKIECGTGALAGFEALARWHHPERGLVMPDQFLPILERCGLMNRLTDSVLDQALAWFSSAPAGLTLSVNFSAKTFRDTEFLERIFDRCLNSNVAPHSLIFELTETDSMDEPLVALDLTTRLRMKGFQLSIDDFGKGYSSLLQLIRLPFSELKVDKSFVLPVKRSKEARTVVKSIVDLARGLGLKSVAEGVEDPETLDYLKEIGCDLAQGYAIASPMTAEALTGWLVARV